MAKCYDVLLENGEMFFGIPNMQHIVEQKLCPGFGVMFEHNIFYNKENVSYLLRKHQFEILEIHDYLNHSILFHVKKCSPSMPIYTNSAVVTNVTISDFHESILTYFDFIKKCKETVELLPKQCKIYLFSASYNTQLLLAMGLCNLHIDGILDNCVEKQNKYLFGYDILIKSPNVLTDKTNSVVILKSGYYSGEIALQIQKINSDTVIIA